MNREKLWERFYETGTIADYLEYCAEGVNKKEHTDANNDRSSSEGASCGRTG